MRPTKLTQQLLEAFDTVLSDELNILVCTDEELCILINDLLPEHLQISYRSFQRYKAQVQGMLTKHLKEAPIPETAEVPVEVEKQELMAHLYLLFRKAVIKQKRSLMKQILAHNHGWQRFKWLLHTKFAEFNPKAENHEPARFINDILYAQHNGRNIVYWGEGWYYADPIDFDESELNWCENVLMIP